MAVERATRQSFTIVGLLGILTAIVIMGADFTALMAASNKPRLLLHRPDCTAGLLWSASFTFACFGPRNSTSI